MWINRYQQISVEVVPFGVLFTMQVYFCLFIFILAEGWHQYVSMLWFLKHFKNFSQIINWDLLCPTCLSAKFKTKIQHDDLFNKINNPLLTLIQRPDSLRLSI